MLLSFSSPQGVRSKVNKKTCLLTTGITILWYFAPTFISPHLCGHWNFLLLAFDFHNLCENLHLHCHHHKRHTKTNNCCLHFLLCDEPPFTQKIAAASPHNPVIPTHFYFFSCYKTAITAICDHFSFYTPNSFRVFFLHFCPFTAQLWPVLLVPPHLVFLFCL